MDKHAISARRGFGSVAAVLLAGAVAGVALVKVPAAGPIVGAVGAPASCRVVDGDTLRCGSERVRLLGIDAPEMSGHCRQGRVCAVGDPYASADSLRSALVGPLSFDVVGLDRYGRTLATVRGDLGDLSCWQLAHGQAVYKPRWDNGGRVATICPRFAQ